MKHNAISHGQELAAARNTKPRRSTRKPSQAALAAQAQYQETLARWRQEGNFPQIVLERHGLSK